MLVEKFDVVGISKRRKRRRDREKERGGRMDRPRVSLKRRELSRESFERQIPSRLKKFRSFRDRNRGTIVTGTFVSAQLSEIKVCNR